MELHYTVNTYSVYGRIFCFWSENNIFLERMSQYRRKRNLSQGRQTTLYKEQTKISYQNK